MSKEEKKKPEPTVAAKVESLVPEGFRKLEPDELVKWREARLGLELVQTRVEADKNKIEGHENGLALAKLQLEKDERQLGSVRSKLMSLEMGFGVKLPKDLIIRGQDVFVKKPETASVPAKRGSLDDVPGDGDSRPGMPTKPG